MDSGAQYYDGTTDVTRTILKGKPTSRIKAIYTSVLKGHIGLSLCKFPSGTTGSYLDSIARRNLWQHQLNFNHGTGHGVGHCLHVHEGPHRISLGSNIPLKEGMIFSNEPGYYEDNKFGIRIENLVYVKKSMQINKSLPYLETEVLTLVPYEKTLIEKKFLQKDEIEWLNRYHKRVFDTISPLLKSDENAWLRDKCKKIT